MNEIKRIEENTNEWKISQAKFQGYTKAKLDSIHNDLYSITKTINTHSEKISKLEQTQEGMKVKLSTLSIVFGIIGGLIAAILKFI